MDERPSCRSRLAPRRVGGLEGAGRMVDALDSRRPSGAQRRSRFMNLTKLGALVAGAVLVVGACSSTGGSAAPGSAGASGGASKGTVKIGVDLPLSGAETTNGQP